MKCYVDARDGDTKDAVAICSTCGMGLCMEHLVHQELPLRVWPAWPATRRGAC